MTRASWCKGTPAWDNSGLPEGLTLALRIDNSAQVISPSARLRANLRRRSLLGFPRARDCFGHGVGV